MALQPEVRHSPEPEKRRAAKFQLKAVAMRSGGEGRCDETASLEAAVPEESVIVISDDEGEVSLGLGNSVLLIEDAGEDSILQEKKTLEVLDEELAITFSRKAHVMPHARYDCSMHPFTRFEEETQIPIEKNASFCAECYCYLCDKPASECLHWTTPEYCHCNAHNKSQYWKQQRDVALVGVLTMFNLDLTEIDTELKEGGNKLHCFLLDLWPVYQEYLKGSLLKRDTVEPCLCSCHKGKAVNHKCNMCTLNHTLVKFFNYSLVHKTVTDFLNHIDEEKPKAAAVMLLGTAKELIIHKVLPNPFTLKDPLANIKDSSVNLMTRIMTTLQRLLVLKDYPKTLYDKFVGFFQRLRLPPHFYSFTSSLNVMRWDNCLLTSVLAGQNLTGVRTSKGKKESLWEALTVVQSRVRKLENDKSYRQLVRYLNAVQCPESAGLVNLRKKLCFYICKYGDFSTAAYSLIVPRGTQGSICKYFTPALFELHVAMLRLRSCPPGNEAEWTDVWAPQSGSPLKRGLLIRTALHILFSNNNLFRESKCWSSLVRMWCMSEMLSKEGRVMPLCLYEPDKTFLQKVMSSSCSILDELQRVPNVFLPQPFHKVFHNTAELILIVQAVVRFLMATMPPLRGMLELIAAFGLNHWALSLLIEGISSMSDLLRQFVSCVNRELHEEQQRILELLINRGPNYVSHLVPVFLLHHSEGVRSVGFSFIDFVLKNMAHIPWSGTLGNCLEMKVLPFSHSYSISQGEQKRLTANIGRLISRS
ncbi:uncharacterized protein [Ranitomeya imitator]|uniref:uncharacterized protein n=1 Tax=Ranitomeya imitator TaxID=111125 RepID=UPI0037E9934D